MATAYTHKRKRQHKESKKGRSNNPSVRRSIFGEIDKTKEYAIYWLCNNSTSSSNCYEISNVKLRGIVDYLRKISDISDIRKTDDENVFLVMDFTSLEKHFVQVTSLNQIRLIYVYDEHNGNSNDKNRDELFVECPKVSDPVALF
jgi:hypothetical protein